MTDPDLQPVEAIYDALDRDDPLEGLRLARSALVGGAAQDPVVRFLAGVCLLELDQPSEAARELRQAVDQDPEDGEFRSHLALALFRQCAFAEAADEARRAVEVDPKLADAHYTLALLAERAGADNDAERGFRTAARLDPQAFPLPARLDPAAFEAELEAAREMLAPQFRKHLDEVAVTVEDLPSDEVLTAEEPPLDPELLGLFVGVPLSERSSFSPGGELPPRILIFKRNLERSFPDVEELRRQIANTLHHELGHYLGLDEDELDAIGLG